MEEIIKKQAELIQIYKDHLELVGAELSEIVSIAVSHGWRSTRYEQGEKIEKRLID